MTIRSKLTRTEARWANAAYGAIFPAAPERGFEVGICDMDLEGYLDDLRAHVSGVTAFGIRFAIAFVALAPLFVIGKVATLASLAPADRERVVARLVTSRIYLVRQMVMILKATGALLYGGHPAIRRRCMGSVPSTGAGGPALLKRPATSRDAA